MGRIIVLVTEGKRESVDYAKVFTFTNGHLANEFCRITNTGKEKYWKKAEIVDEGEQIELCQPEVDA